MVKEAAERDAETVVLTFDPHPRKVLFGKDSGLQLIQSLDQRIEKLAETGLDHLVIQPFDRAFSRLRPEEFVRDVLVEGLGTTTIVVGHDHRFGAGREGDVELLKACGETYGFNVQHIPAHIEGEITVSSTKVRQRIRDGAISEAQNLLGHSPSWRGTVVHGDGRGQELGYPTANLSAEEPDQLLPAEGVYAARVHALTHDNPTAAARQPQGWAAMVHIGPRPTFEDADSAPTVEVHLFDDQAPELYGAILEVAFEARIREVQKFESAQALVEQLDKDAKETKRILGYA